MTPGILLLEFALLGFIAAVYALARRNLTAAAVQERAATAESLREVQETVAGLISVLQREAAEIEARLDKREERLRALMDESERGAATKQREAREHTIASAPIARETPEPVLQRANPTASALDRALQLIADGASPLSAARQTALTVTEVEMAARMRGLQA